MPPSTPPIEPHQHRDSLQLLVLFALLPLTFAIYSPGLTGLFLFDDHHNIVHNPNIHIESLSAETLTIAAGTSDSGPLGRPVSMISFALNYYLHGLDEYAYKLTNLIIHLINGVALFLLTHLILATYKKRHHPELRDNNLKWVALAVCAAWLLHPLNLTSALYVVQRMTSLAALFSFATLTLYLWGRLRQLDNRNGWPQIASALVITTPLAILSKENALLIPLFLFLLEWLLLGFEAPTRSTRRALVSLFVLIAAIPTLLACLYILTHPNWLIGGYDNRPFTLAERILTEPRVLWFYISLIFAPSLSRLSIYHDDFPLSHGWLDPITTLPSIAGILGLIIAALVLRKRQPLIAFGVLFYFVGHSMESSIFALEIAHEHRNYLPIYGILLPLFYYLAQSSSWHKSQKTRQFIAMAIIAGFGLITLMRADTWGDPVTQLVLNANYHPNSPRGNYDVGRIYFILTSKETNPVKREEYYLSAQHHFKRAYESNPFFSTGLVALIRLDDMLGKPIARTWIEELTRRLNSQPVIPATIRAVQELHNCNLAGDCNIPPGAIDMLLDAPLRNTKINPNAKAVLITEASIHALNSNNLPKALELSRAAVKLNKKAPQHRLNLISLLIQAQLFDEARTEISDLKQQNLKPKMAQRLAIQESELRNAIQTHGEG